VPVANENYANHGPEAPTANRKLPPVNCPGGLRDIEKANPRNSSRQEGDRAHRQ
jgi:hypothetical protein